MRTRMLVKVGLAVVLAAVVLGGCHFTGEAFKAKFTKSEELTAPLTDIATLDVNTNIGRIEFVKGDVNEVRITAEIKIKARTEERAQELGEQVRIVAEPSGQVLRIKAIKPAGLEKKNLSVDYTITAPAALALTCTTNVGDVRIADFTNSVEAHVNVGTVLCTGLRGNANLETNVGDIRAEYAADAPAAVSINATSNVGDVELAGPQDLSAQVAAETNVGSINSDRPLTVTGPIKRSIRASIGSGDGRINLRTNVGSIRIR